MSGGILLVTINAKWIHPSLALRLLKANLGALEKRCEILEFNLRQPLAEKLEALRVRLPVILGISVSIWNHRATLELLKALGWGDARPLVVMGGPELSYLPADAEIFRYADYVIRGEGELAFRGLCEELLGEEANAALGETAPRRSDVVSSSGATPRNAPHFIDAVPVDLTRLRPAYHYYTGEDLNRKLVYVESSRGCPYHCAFCLGSAECTALGTAVPTTSPVRHFPLEPFLAQMENLIAQGARTFKFLDRTFNFDISRALAVLEFFLEHIKAQVAWDRVAATPTTAQSSPARRPLCVHFEMVPGRFPPELLAMLRRFPPGSLRLEVGIQTLNPGVAALIDRPGDSDTALTTLRTLSGETNAIIHADLIAGLPGEDYVSFAAGFDKLWLALSGTARAAAEGRAAPHAEIQLGILKLLPGAAIARCTASHGMEYAAEPPYEVLSTAAFPRAALDRIKNFARFWELIMNRDSFPDITARLFPPGVPVFQKFMELSDSLLAQFGRNWGIDKQELWAALDV
jgi:radical SAM superfamily enzyme YgiQ (UPF0313 family)